MVFTETASKSATQNSISDELFEIVYLWAINYLWVRSLYMKLMDFNIMNTLMLKIGMIRTSRQPKLCWTVKYNVVTAFQRNIFIFLFSTVQNLHLFSVIRLVQSSMHLYIWISFEVSRKTEPHWTGAFFQHPTASTLFRWGKTLLQSLFRRRTS